LRVGGSLDSYQKRKQYHDRQHQQHWNEKDGRVRHSILDLDTADRPRSLLEDNSVKSKSTTLFNAQTTYEVNKQLRLRFDVFNIFDRKTDDITNYYRSRLPGEPAGGVNDIHFHPVERRSLRLAMLFKF
jgi:outer membrane receptor protein involved in Fe transport